MMITGNRILFFGFIGIFLLTFSVSPVSAENGITLNIPDTVEVGDSFVIQGIIDPSSPFLFPDEVTLLIRAPMDSQVDQFSTLIPDASRTFEKSIPADITGKWTVSVRYGNITAGPVELKVIPRTSQKKTTLNLLTYGAPVDIRDKVEMSGILLDDSGIGVPDRKIIYEVAIPSYSWYGTKEPDEDERIWQIYGSAWTDSTGRFAFSFPVYERGSHGVRAYFAGDEIYSFSRSGMERIRVGI